MEFVKILFSVVRKGSFDKVDYKEGGRRSDFDRTIFLERIKINEESRLFLLKRLYKI